VIAAERKLADAANSSAALERQAQEARFQARAAGSAARRAERSHRNRRRSQVAANCRPASSCSWSWATFDDAAAQAGLQARWR
jgi:chromosome segregation protein